MPLFKFSVSSKNIEVIPLLITKIWITPGVYIIQNTKVVKGGEKVTGEGKKHKF